MHAYFSKKIFSFNLQFINKTLLVLKVLLVLIAISSISVAFAGNSEADYEKELLESEGGQLATEIIDRLNTSVYRGNSNEQMVSEFIKKYFDELYVVEVKIANEMAKEESDRTLMDNYLEQKRQIFNRYWLQDDPQTVYYYYPISWSGTPSHDWSKVENVSIFETGDEVKPQYLMSYTYEGITYVFSLIYHNNELKIQDFFFKIS